MSKNKKAIVLALFLFIFHSAAQSQSYFEDFDKLEVGKGIAAQSLSWLETFGNGRPGQRSSDAKVVKSNSFSGDNALFFKFENNVQTDVRLNLGSSYELGVVKYDMKMNISRYASAYFEVRGSVSLATDVSLAFETNGSGSYTVEDGSGNQLASGSHPQEEWFDLELVMDLSANKWSITVGNSTPQVFACPLNKAAYIRLVGSDRSVGFYVDDVRYKVKPYEFKDFNLGMNEASYTGGQFEGSPVAVTATVRNLGSYEINVMTLGIIYNDVLYKETIDGLSFFTGNSYTHQFDTTFPAVGGTHYAEVLVLEVEGKPDEEESDNVKILKIRPIVPAAGKKILVESGVSTYCGDCPSVYVTHQWLVESLPGLVVPIEIHKDDPMSPAVAYADFFGNYRLPYSLLHRSQELSTKITTLVGQMTNELEREPLATMEIGAVINPDSSVLTLTVAYAIKQLVEAEGWKVACAWVENNVRGLETGYNQRNNYWNASMGEMGGYEQLPRIIQGKDMVYQHVLRSYQPSYLGNDELPVGKQLGDSLLFSFTFSRSDMWQLPEGRLVAMLIRPDGSIDNVQDASIYKALSRGEIVLGMQSLSTGGLAIGIYPNPASDLVSIFPPTVLGNSLLSIHSAEGLLAYASQCTGGIPLAINTTDWPRGIYVVSLGSQGQVSHGRFVLR